MCSGVYCLIRHSHPCEGRLFDKVDLAHLGVPVSDLVHTAQQIAQGYKGDQSFVFRGTCGIVMMSDDLNQI